MLLHNRVLTVLSTQKRSKRRYFLKVAIQTNFQPLFKTELVKSERKQMKSKRKSNIIIRKLKLKTQFSVSSLQFLVSSKNWRQSLGKCPEIVTEMVSNHCNRDHVPTAYSVSDAKQRTSQM